MDFINPNALYVACALVCVMLARYIYAGLTNPLSNIPEPWYTRYTTLVSTSFVITAHHPVWVHALHAKYEPAVRISPHEVDISGAPACQRVIHSVKGGFLKSPFYSLLTTDSSSVFNETRPEVHRKYKRLAVRPHVRDGPQDLPAPYRRQGPASPSSASARRTRRAAPPTLPSGCMFLSFDVIGDLTFGEGFGQLESGEKNQSINDFVSRGLVGGLRSMFPKTAWLSLYLPVPVFRDATTVQYRTFDYAKSALDLHARRVKEEEGGEDTRPTVFSKLYTAGAEDAWSPVEIRDNAQVFIVGGSDTTANTMTYLVWAICKLPDVRANLLRELAGTPEEEKG